MSPDGSVGLNATHEHRVAGAARQVRISTIERDLAIVDAFEAGVSSRRIAAWAELTHTAVLAIRRRINLRSEQAAQVSD
jgi:hypothetical protein